MNFIFFALVAVAFLFSGWRQVFFIPGSDSPAPMETLSRAMVDSAGGAVELVCGWQRDVTNGLPVHRAERRQLH